MSFNKNVPESVVIVRGKSGAVATLRYSDASKDKIISSPSGNKDAIYKAIEAQVMGKKNYGKKS